MTQIWSWLWMAAQIPLLALCAIVVVMSYVAVAAIIIGLSGFLVKRSKKEIDQ